MALDEALLDEYRLAQESNHPLAVIMIDADHFKRVNDNYGHTVGDIVLQKMAKLLAVQGWCQRHGCSFWWRRVYRVVTKYKCSGSAKRCRYVYVKNLKKKR